MTYQELYNSALSRIKSMCLNVSNYGGLNSAFKAGYTRNYTTGRATLTARISNPIGQVSSSTVDNEFRNWMTTCGITSYLNKTVEVDSRGLFNFYGALASFATAKIRTIAGTAVTTQQVVYVTGTNPTSITRLPTDGRLMYANDVSTYFNQINSIITNNTKAYVVKYSYSFSVS